MKITLYTLAILFLIYSLLIRPDPIQIVYILLFLGGFGFFAKQLYTEIMAKQKS